MAIKINFDSSHNAIPPTIVLATKSGKRIGKLPANDIAVKDCMNNAANVSFSVNKIDIKNIELWTQLVDFKTVWVKEWNQFFEISVKSNETNELEKNVTAVSLGHAELSQINLYNIEINTTDDIDRDDYAPTVFYDEARHNISLLHRVLEKATHYRIGHVDASIARLQRSFSFDKKTIKDAFDEIARELECLFIYSCYLDEDDNIVREINVYDLKDYCTECGNRGSFEDSCPECGSANIVHGYGDDTTIFISSDNLSDEVTLSTDTGSVKNCFKLEAGDDLMTATIANCNPNGSSYLWYLSDATRKDMSAALSEKLSEYDNEYAECQSSREFDVDSLIIDDYNMLVEKYSERYDAAQQIPAMVVGYPSVVKAYYDSIDFKLFLKNGMMPSIELDDTTAEQEASKLNNVSMKDAAVKKLSSSSKTSVDSVVLSKAKSIIDRRFTVSIATSSYEDGVWKGVFIISRTSNPDDAYSTQTITTVINEEYEQYVRQKIDSLLSNKRSDSESSNVKDVFGMDIDSFSVEIKKYALEQLINFRNICQSCIDIMVEQGAADPASGNIQNEKIYQELYLPMAEKMQRIEEEVSIRENEVNIISGVFDSDGRVIRLGVQNVLLNIISDVRNMLDMQSYLGEDLWNELISFRREDTYSNQNYISDGLSNEDMFRYATEFIRIARDDIIKSATMQHSITASLKNLLVIKEFSPLVQYFKTGNWLRVRIDGHIYRLRLLDYEIKFNDLSYISVSFSDVTYINDELSDIKSVLKSASSMASSYTSVSRQAKSGEDSKNALNDWVANGLSATQVSIVSNSDNQNIIWDEHGILCREYLPEFGEYDISQLKIINKGLYITDDNWRSARAGIGEFVYYNPVTKKMEQSFGVIADTIVGNIILSKSVGVYNEENTVSIDKSGVVITTNGDLNEDETQTLFTIQKKTTSSDGNENYEKLLYVNDDGEVVINGSVKIYSGNDHSTFEELALMKSDFTDYKAEMGQYITYDDNGLFLGALKSQFRTNITNDSLRFLEGEYTVAYISNKELKINRATIDDSITIGGIEILPRNGGASIIWAERVIK